MAGMELHVGIRGLKNGTNINTIEVPEQLKLRRKTGVEWFDGAIGGEGFVPSSVMMLTGDPGAGKTTMMLQVADSLTKQGHICLYNTGEESLYQVAMVKDRLKLRNGFIVGQDIMVPKLLTHADFLRKKHPDKQIVILQDSLQTLDDGFYADKNGNSRGTNSMTPLRVVEALTNWAKSTYGIVGFIGQVNKNGEFNGKQALLHAVDIRARFFIDQRNNSETKGERIFQVTKNRFGCSGKAFILGMGSAGLFEKGYIAGDDD
jgi:DNA repair protein RadA/Sms